jgi:hypothetical protein
VVLWVLLACGPQPGRPGDADCEPLLVDGQCSIWECWEVHDGGAVSWTYEYDREDGKRARTDPCWGVEACFDALVVIAREACGVDLAS